MLIPTIVVLGQYHFFLHLHFSRQKGQKVCVCMYLVRTNGCDTVKQKERAESVKETETETKSESHLWPVLGEHSYELVRVGLAALVQKAWTQMLSPGRHLWRRKTGHQLIGIGGTQPNKCPANLPKLEITPCNITNFTVYEQYTFCHFLLLFNFLGNTYSRNAPYCLVWYYLVTI